MDAANNLWFRVALPFVLFVVAGSLGLVEVLHATYRHQSSTEFQQLAVANSEFLQRIHLPLNDRFAEYLTHVLGVRVSFRPTDAPAGNRTERNPFDRLRASGVPLRGGP